MNKKKLNCSLDQLPEGWRGFTLDELRYQRAVVKLRLELAKEAVVKDTNTIRKNGLIPMLGHSRGIFSKLTGAFGYFDYAYLGFKLIGRTRSIFKKFKRSSR